VDRDLKLSPTAAERMRRAITRARGNEVCFLARVEEDGTVEEPRVVARGRRDAVLAAVRDAESGMLVIHNHPSGELEPSDPDLTLAADLYARGVGLAITDNRALELYVVVEPARARQVVPIDVREVEWVLGPGGPVQEWHPAYEDRPAQRDLAAAVVEVYNRGGIALVEAGTGTGKSIAYLLPAVRWALQNRERTVVSTNTINLQEQLVGKDLPFLRKALGEPFRFALVKGRRNYVSIRRARLALQAQAVLFDDAAQAELRAIGEWLRETRDGTLQDLPFTPSPEVWDEVASESDACLRAKCPHFQECFYQRARRDAAGADILVVNHHLLFSDLAVRRAQGNFTAPAVLPPYHRLILDEAHNLEEAATSHLGASVTRRGLARLLGRLDRRGKGILAAVEERLRAGPDDLLQQDALAEIAGRIRPAVERAREHATELFGRLEVLVNASADGIERITPESTLRPEWDAIATLRDSAVLVLEDLARLLDGLRGRILLDSRWAEALEEPLIELSAAAGRIRGAGEAIRLALSPAEDALPMVRWLERRGAAAVREGALAAGGAGGANTGARAAPIDLAELLRDDLFERVDTAVLTSATLATRDGFGYLRRRLGLVGGGLRLHEAVFPSPFDFETQTVLAVPTDVPEPRGEADGVFDRATARVAADLARASDGGIFVLFTAYRALRSVAAELRGAGLEARWPLFVQGEMPRAKLLERFTASGRGILLGVASFWEGVDVPGEPLRGLVLAKLPFQVPSEPITAARIEAIAREGGNPFRDYTLPQAALRLKQGFGRLIRSRTDRGAVVLLDRRILERNYGGYLLESLPPAPLRAAPWPVLRAELEAFYARGPAPRGVAGGGGVE